MSLKIGKCLIDDQTIEILFLPHIKNCYKGLKGEKRIQLYKILSRIAILQSQIKENSNIITQFLLPFNENWKEIVGQTGGTVQKEVRIG